MNPPVVLSILFAVFYQLGATLVPCNCGASYYLDSKCTNTIYPNTSYEYQMNCISNMMPLGSWAIFTLPNSSRPLGAFGMSYMIKACTSAFSTTVVVNAVATMPLVGFDMWNGTGCVGTPISSQTFPPDNSCQPIWIFSDLFYAKFVCSAAFSTAVLSPTLTLLGLALALWALIR